MSESAIVSLSRDPVTMSVFLTTFAVTQVAILNVETLAVSGGAGDDTIDASSIVQSTGASIFLSGGDGNDVIRGSQGADTINGGSGDDFIDGNRGIDVLLGGGGADTFQWDPGDGSDTIDGGSGSDTLQFNGSNAGEKIGLAAGAGGHAILSRDVATITQDLNSVETVNVHALGGIDTITVGDLSGTDVKQVNIDLAATGGAPDGVLDSVSLTGRDGSDHIVVTNVGGVTAVTGLAAGVTIGNADNFDKLLISTGGGNDAFDASAINGQITLSVSGGDGNDSLVGSHGADVLVGDAGSDMIMGGDGDDTLTGGSGSDRFVFTSGSTGRDIITDFQAHAPGVQADQIVLNGFTDHSFNDLVAHGDIAQSGADVVISGPGGAIVTLTGVSLASLHANDFLFG